jgi:hypothetical protein
MLTHAFKGVNEMRILTDEEITATEESAGKSYRRHQSSIRGQMVTPQDDYQWHYARAIEAAVLSKLAEQDMEPKYWVCRGELYEVQQFRLFPDNTPCPGQEKLYTEAQLLAAQQRTAEACAKVCDQQAKELECPERATYCAEEIRNGEWREYL